MPQIFLGLFDGYMSAVRDKLTSETKIGGTATYFPSLTDSQRATIKKWTSCGVCGMEMSLLLQVFSPLPLKSSIHHRMVYVFCCNSSVCSRQPSSSSCAFSLQDDKVDEEALRDDEEDDVIQMDPLTKDELQPRSLPPCYVDVVPEPKKEIIVPTDLEAEMIKVAEENARHPEVSETDVRELEQTVDLKDKQSDYAYEKFRRRMARKPTQVVRYYEHEVSNEILNYSDILPLYMNLEKVKTILRVPPCSSCGAPLIHELQIMPTSIYFLRAENYASKGQSGGGDDGLDFGTVTVFICSRCCSRNSSGVVLRKEFVFVEKAPELDDEIDASNGKMNLRNFMTEA